MKDINKKRAFTLVELLIVIVVIGILFIVVVANVDFSTDAAKEAGVQSTFQSYKLAAETAALECGGFLKDEAELIRYLNKRLDRELQFTIDDEGNISTSNADPWGTEFRIEKSQPINTYGQLTFTSAGPDTRFDTNDDIIMAVKYVMKNGRGETVTTYPEYDANHTHVYTQQVVANAYKKSDANCDSPALYYYSCECGAASSSTFEKGEKNPNVHEVTVDSFSPLANGKHLAKKICVKCSAVVEELEEAHDTTNGTTCPDCGGTLHEHSFTQQVQTNTFKKNDADCTKPLTYYYSCECGEAGTETFTIGTTTSHDFSKETTDYFASTATCKQPAQYYYSCIGCNAQGTVTYSVGTVDLTNHIGNDVTTYTSAGTQHYKIVKCNACGNEKSSTLENHSPTTGTCTLCNNHTHAWTETATEANKKSDANCQSAAVYYKSCSCGAKGTTTFTYGNVDSNVHVGTVTATNGTASVHSKYSGCGHTYSTTHSYSESIITNATCTTNGQKKLTCVCGYFKYETITAPGHTAGADATCESDQLCTVCGAVLNEAGGHIYNREVQSSTYWISNANCQAPLTYYKSCSCGAKGNATFTVGEKDFTKHVSGCIITNVATSDICQRYSLCGTIVSTEHSYTYDCDTSCNICGYIRSVSHSANADDNNCTTAVYCRYGCGTIMTNAKSHTYDNACDTTCNNSGCTAGNRTIEHNYTVDSGVQYSAATCTDARKNYLKCSICNHNPQSSSYVVSTGDALGHIWEYECSTVCSRNSSHTRSAEHSMTNVGSASVHQECSYDCGYQTTSHSYTVDSGVQYSAATCTTARQNYKQCSCGYNPRSSSYLISTGSVNASAHNWGSWSKISDTQHKRTCAYNNAHTETANCTFAETKTATCTTTGTKVCSTCNQTVTIAINASNHTGTNTKKIKEENKCIGWTCCGAVTDTEHSYTYTCSTTCNDCGYVRSASHSANADDNNCTTAVYCRYGCGTIVTNAKSHTYDNACDTTCNNSGCTAGNRSITHQWGGAQWSDIQNEVHKTCYRQCTICSAYDYATNITTISYTTPTCVQREKWYCQADFSNGDYATCSYEHEGDYGAHNMTRYGADMSQHWDYCTLCSYTTNYANHTVTSWTKTHVGDGRWKIAGSCNVCFKDLTHYHDVNSDEPCPYCNVTVEHDWVFISSSTGYDCQHYGFNTYECSYCGAEYSVANSNYGDHRYQAVGYWGGTCQENGWERYECSVCGDSYYETLSLGPHQMVYYARHNDSQHWDECALCGYEEGYENHKCNTWSYTKISDGYYRISGLCYLCNNTACHYHDIYSNDDCPYCDLVICEYSGYCYGDTMSFTCKVHGDVTNVSTSLVSSYTAKNCSEYSVTYHSATYNGVTITCNGHPVQGSCVDLSYDYTWAYDCSYCTGTISCQRCSKVLMAEQAPAFEQKYYTAKDCTEYDLWEHYVIFDSSLLKNQTCSCSFPGASGDHYMNSFYRSGTCKAYAGYDWQCDYCAYSYFESLNVYGDHNYEVTGYAEPDCSSLGYWSYICTICNKTKTEFNYDSGYGPHDKFYYHGNEKNLCWYCSCCDAEASHDFLVSGECTDPTCTAKCGHSSKTPYYVEVDDETHYQYSECTYCGNSTFVGEYSHDYLTGVCYDCNYSCPHTFTGPVYYYVNQTYHSLDSVCDVCKVSTSSKIEAHRGSGTTCLLCQSTIK